MKLIFLVPIDLVNEYDSLSHMQQKANVRQRYSLELKTRLTIILIWFQVDAIS